MIAGNGGARRLLRALTRISTTALAFIVASTAFAQASPSAYTRATRYDAMSRVVGTIEPDPDGSGSLSYAAVRYTYDALGNVTKVEKGELASWQAETVAPASWTGFTVLQTLDVTFDSLGRKIAERVKGSDGVVTALTQYGYDAAGRLECTAIRMNPSIFSTVTATTGACSLGSEASPTFGKDRITKNFYDPAGQLTQVRKAYGTSLDQAYATYTYSANGKQTSVTDANGNKATLTYDGFDRLIGWTFPSKTTPGVSASCTLTGISEVGGIAGPTETRDSSDDCEKYAYDRNGNRRKLMKRDGTVIRYTVDALNRVTLMDIPSRSDLATTHTRDVFYTYNARGLMTAARFDSAAGEGITTVYDDFGEISSSTISMDSASRTQYYCFDNDGNRTRMSFPDSSTSSGNCQTTWTNYVAYTYDGRDRPLTVSSSAPSWSHTYAYNQRGELVSDTIGGSGGTRTFGRDPVGRLSSLALNVAATSFDTTSTIGSYNPASQIAQESRSNDAFAYTARANLGRSFTSNGLNQYSAVSGTMHCYDVNGNLTADGTSVYLYDVENRLVEKRVQTNSNCSSLGYGGTLQARLRYDPMGRLYETDDDPNDTDNPEAGADLVRFLYDGDALVAEYNRSGALFRRYVHGADGKADDPIAWYEGSAMSSGTLRFLFADRQGSIALTGDSAGNGLRIFAFDEYGIPTTAGGPANLMAANGSRFLYTGQAWLPEAGIYYYKARIYSPTLGRFLQVDPVGYKDQINLYAYVANDPVNGTDPDGKFQCVSNGNGTQTCTASGLLDIAAMYVYKGLVETGVVTPTSDGTSSGNQQPTTASNPSNDGNASEMRAGGSRGRRGGGMGPYHCTNPQCGAAHGGSTGTTECPDCDGKRRRGSPVPGPTPRPLPYVAPAEPVSAPPRSAPPPPAPSAQPVPPPPVTPLPVPPPPPPKPCALDFCR